MSTATNQTAREFLAQWCAEARKRCDAATPGPWKVAVELPTIVDVAGRDSDTRPTIAFCGTMYSPEGAKDAALIVIAANALPALVAFVEAMFVANDVWSVQVSLNALAKALGWKEGE